MAYKRYPHTATLGYFKTGHQSTLGYWSNGTLATIHVHCNIQPKVGGFIAGTNGDQIPYSYNIFCPILSLEFATTTGLKIQFNGTTHLVVQAFNFQKHTEIKV